MVSILVWRGPSQGAEGKRAGPRWPGLVGEGGWNHIGRAAVRASLLKPFSGLVTSSLAVVWEALAVTASHICQCEELRAGSNFLCEILVESNFLKHLILQLIKYGCYFLCLDV